MENALRRVAGGVLLLAVLPFLAVPVSGQDLAKPPSALRLLGEFDVGQGGDVTSLAFSPDGSLLAAGSDAGEVVVSRVDNGELVLRFLAARETATLTFSPDGKRLAAVGGRDLRVFTIPRGEMVAAREVCERSPVAWRADGEVLAVQVTTSDVSFVAADDLREQRRIPLGAQGQLRVLTLDPDGQHLSVVQHRRGLVTIELPTGERGLLARGELTGAVSLDAGRWFVTHEPGASPVIGQGIEDLGQAHGVVAAPAAGQLLIAARTLTWRTRGGDVLCNLPHADAMALRPSGDLAALARRGVVQLVSPGGSVVRELRGHRARPHEVVIAGGGFFGGRSVVASRSPSGAPVGSPNVFVYDVSTGERHAATITPSPRGLRASSASPDVLLTGERNLLWHPRARRTTLDLGPGHVPSSPVWSPDARWIWMGSPGTVAPRDEVDTVFDLASGGERGFATPNGSWPLAWRRDGEALLLAAQIADSFGGGRADLTLSVHGGVHATVILNVLVHQAVWSPDGRTIALATNGGILILDGETLATKAKGLPRSAWVRYLDAHHVVCSGGNRVTVLRADSGDVVLAQPLRAGLDHRPSQYPLLGPSGDASADGRIVVAADGVGVQVFEVVR